MYSMFLIFGAIIFAVLMLMIEIGYRVGKRGEENADAGLRAIDGFAFATLGFMLSFSLYSGNSRLDDRRDHSLQQVNALKTIIRRADLVPSEGKEPLQSAARQYAEAVVRVTESDAGAALTKAYEGETLARRNLKAVVYDLARRHPENPFVQSALDATDSVASLAAMSRLDGARHVPSVIYWLLLSLSAACAFLAGRLFRIDRRRQLGHRIVYSLLVSAIIVAIIDFDTPNRGLITSNDTERLMLEMSR